jgi:hypothetical protein
LRPTFVTSEMKGPRSPEERARANFDLALHRSATHSWNIRAELCLSVEIAA